MKNVEKDRIALNTIINVLLAIIFAIAVYYVVKGYNTVPPVETDKFILYAGPGLIILGIFGTAFAYIKKKKIFIKYTQYFAMLGVMMLLFKYSFLHAPFAIGFYLYYSLLLLTALYIAWVIGYTVYRVKKG